MNVHSEAGRRCWRGAWLGIVLSAGALACAGDGERSNLPSPAVPGDAAGDGAPAKAPDAATAAGPMAPPAGSAAGGRDVDAGMPDATQGTSAPGPTADSGAARADAASTAEPGPDANVVQASPQLAISADFLNQTLSIFDVDKLAEGKKRSDVLVGTVDLKAYSPGPLALAVTPDGKTALVSISAGFLGAFITVPPGDGKLLFVDLEKRAVVSELFTGKSPMGIVISPDGKRAFVGQYAEDYFAVVDIQARTFQKVPTGSQYNEELAIDDTGSVGILTYGPAGNAKTFSVADPAGKIGQTLGLTGDAAGVAFFPGTKTAYLLQAPTLLTANLGGHDLVDVSEPTRPSVSDGVRVPNAPTMYPVTAVKKRGSVVFPSTENNMLSLIEMKLNGARAEQLQKILVGSAKSLAYGVAATPDGRALLAVPGEHYVGVVDLAAQKAFTVPWEVSMSGPNDIKLIPKQ